MSEREPFEGTVSASQWRLSDLAIPATAASLVAMGVFWIAISDPRDIASTTIFLFLVAIAGGTAAALGVRWSNRSFGPKDDQSHALHPGWFRYAPGRSGPIGALAIVGLMATAVLRAPWMGPPMLLCVVCGALAAPVVFLVQRKRSARALPPSIR